MIYITFKYRYRKQIILITFSMILLITTIFLTIKYLPKNETNKKKLSIPLSKNEKKDPIKTDENYIVDIKGEINSPGIYKMTSNNRVIDVIEKAGGLTENANTSVINLSKKITDEMVIIIYSNLEIRNFEKTKEKEEYLQSKCKQKDEDSLTNDACIGNTETKEKPSSKVSLNKATLEELMTLTGIGESKAKEIISYREKNEGFKTVEDLMKISGIGESTFAKIKDRITL